MDGNNIQKSIKDGKQVSAGVLTKNGIFALDSAEFIAGLKQCHDKKAIKTKMVKKKQKIVLTNSNKVKAACQNKGTSAFTSLKNSQWKNILLTAYLQ